MLVPVKEGGDIELLIRRVLLTKLVSLIYQARSCPIIIRTLYHLAMVSPRLMTTFTNRNISSSSRRSSSNINCGYIIISCNILSNQSHQHRHFLVSDIP